MADLTTQQDLKIIERVLSDQEQNLKAVLQSKGILELAKKIPNGQSLIDAYIEIRDSGSKKVPEVQRNILAENIICGMVIARHSYAIMVKILSEMDLDDISERARMRDRIYNTMMTSYGKSTDSYLKAMRTMGYDGMITPPETLQQALNELTAAEEDNSDLKNSHEESLESIVNG